MTTGDPAGTPQTERSLPRPGMHFILFGYFCIAVKIPSPPPCGVKTIRWKPSELGCHRPSPSSQSWTSMSMPITMGGSSSARCVFLLLLFVPNGSSAPCDHNQVGGLLILTYRMSVSYRSWVTFGWSAPTHCTSCTKSPRWNATTFGWSG